MSVLDFIFRLPEVIRLLFAAVEYWRVSVLVLIGCGVVAVICHVWDAPAIRMIAGFHASVAFTMAGVLWETNRQPAVGKRS
jgi:hypothetical protein